MPDNKTHTPVLIVGAGPTGLVLALSLARRGIAFRLVDAHDQPSRESRAMGVQARTLEFYRQFGFAEEVIGEGIEARTVHLRRHGRSGEDHNAGSFSLSDMGAGLSPYPFMLTFPQDLHERLLIGKLAELGVTVERGTTLVGFAERDGAVQAELRTSHGTEMVTADYIAGCDGARSAVRETLHLGFSGGTYEQLSYVADVKIARGFDPDITVNLGARSLGLLMPVRATGMQRLIGLVPERLHGRDHVSFDDIRGEIEPLMDVKVMEVNWFSTYRVHHRVAERFRVGRAFLAGDAGHLHSPTGGQGMNTGIGDAINLGWKLAHVLQGRAGAAILDSYEAERIPFARRLVATTDRVFESLIADGFRGDLLRTWLAPMLVNVATRFDTTRHAAFRTVSQIAIAYQDSALSEGVAGSIKGGDRLPWVAAADNFAPLASLDWQAHMYGDAAPEIAAACARHGLALHAFPWSDDADHAGFARGALYLVRPDGYVGLAVPAKTAPRALDTYLDSHSIRAAA
jgi:2-polyprenyl-6-methoxyphenol hydroxylase-like FAD-dependent oxidoreductase